MTFNKKACVIRKMYCGTQSTVPKNYSRKGTPYECLKKGFGIADWEHRKKNLPKLSLQQIMYIGPVYEKNFKKQKIYSITGLLKKVAGITAKEKKTIIVKGCMRSSGAVDQKAFNSIVLFLHDHGVTNLPSCKLVSE